jgi:hypothetical protein
VVFRRRAVARYHRIHEKKAVPGIDHFRRWVDRVDRWIERNDLGPRGWPCPSSQNLTASSRSVLALVFRMQLVNLPPDTSALPQICQLLTSSPETWASSVTVVIRRYPRPSWTMHSSTLAPAQLFRMVPPDTCPQITDD